MVKKSLLWIYLAALWCIAIVASITLVTALVVQYVLMPNINQYKDTIANFVNQTSPQKIVIGNIKANWQGINPHFSLSNIDIFDAQNRPALQLKNTELSLSWLSIPLLEPHLDQILVNSPELTIRRISSGETFVAGISISGASKPELPNWLLRQTKLEVVNAKVIWLDEMRNAPALSLEHLNLEIFSPPWRSLLKNHRLTMSALASSGSNYPIKLSGNVFGNDVSHPEQWHGSVNVQLQQADLTAFKPWVDYPVNLQSGVGTTAITFHFANSQLESVGADVALDQVQLQLKSNADPVLLNQLTGKLSWGKLNTNKLLKLSSYGIGPDKGNLGQTISFKDLSFKTNKGLSLQNAAATYTTDAQGQIKLALDLAHIDLTLINTYLDYLPLSTEVLQQITKLDASGQLNALSFNWEGSDTGTKKYQVNTKFDDLSIQSLKLDSGNDIPGFTRLSGSIKANQNTGILKLRTQNAQLNLKPILRGIIPADNLNGDISWTIKNKITTIHVDKLNLSNPHIAGTVSADYIMDGNKGGLLDLKGQFGQANLKYATLYYPEILGADTLHWLDTSILAGHAENINVIVKGRLADFPFIDSKNNLDSKLGIFRVTAKISDAIVEYGTGWPNVEALGLNMLFEGNRMELNASAGHILGNQIVQSKITIPQLDAKNPILNIVSEFKGATPDLVKFVNNSPVAKVSLGFTDNLITTGTGKLNLSLKIPMQNLESAQYLGLYQIANASMTSPDMPMISQLNGALAFTESTLIAKNIKATIFGAPLAFNLNSGNDKIIHVSAKGRLNDELFRQVMGLKDVVGKNGNYVSGNADWAGDMTIQKPSISMSLRTDLVGVTSRLPAPFTKAQNDPLVLRLFRKQEANSELISVVLGNRLSAKAGRTLINGKMQLDRASVNFNVTKSSPAISGSDLYPVSGLQLTGDLDYLDADAWRNVLNAAQGSTSQELTLPVKKVALKVNVLDIMGRRINQLKLVNIPGKEGFQAAIQSHEISGDVQWLNQRNGKIIAHLSNLTVPEIVPNLEPSTSVPKDFKRLVQDYPALDITADNFEFDKKNFGSLELLAYPQNENWEIQKLKFASAEGTLSADGQWNNWIRNPNTNINLQWDIKDLGNTLKRFGYGDTIKGGQGEVKGHLNWAGSPHEFDTTHLNGSLQFELQKGQILKVQPGVGRLLGLLSLQSLPRRLTLDFRDLFSNGFAFDKISASIKIDQGILRSDNFKMAGPAADVTIKGETNLQKETQHLKVKVMPRISDTLSLAALAGGPLVGAVAFLAQKILKDPLNKIASTEYEIVGTWDNPQEIKSPENSDDSAKNILPN